MESGALAAVDFVAFELESTLFPCLKTFPCIIRGMVVDCDVFQLDAFLEAYSADPLEDGVDVSFLVVDGDHDRKFDLIRHVLSKGKSVRPPDSRAALDVIFHFYNN